MTLTVTYQFNPSTRQVDFFSKGSSANPDVNAAQVNLSRGGNKPYRLDNLQAHNGSGATWDGKGVHTDALREKYINRCVADINAAIATASAPKAVTVAVVA